MKIIADENIPCVAKAFASLGEVELLAGRGLQAADVRDADILLVRSVTRVDEHLLSGSRVRFVGSATIGFDHIDRAFLESRNIGYSVAPGSNATSAAEYVLAALLVLAHQGGFNLQEKTIGIVGCGNVGSQVLDKLSSLGIECLVNDPPLELQGGYEDYVDLDTVLQADAISVHVPLVSDGKHPTWHLFDKNFFSRLQPGAILINTSRGAVTDNAALDEVLGQRDDLRVVLDVWEDEPEISASLLQKVKLATPHIAGYSLDGKLRGTSMIYRAACDYFGKEPVWDAADELAQVPLPCEPGFIAGDVAGNIQKAVLACYDIREDDARLRAMLALPAKERPQYFDRLRKEYPVRREFQAHRIVGADLDAMTQEKLRDLGFRFE